MVAKKSAVQPAKKAATPRRAHRRVHPLAQPATPSAEGLSLEPMSDKEFASAAREAAQATHMSAATRLAFLASHPECDPEIAIKIYNATKDVAGATPDKKGDPFANLPVFHIHFNNGRLTGTEITPASTVQVIDLETFDLTKALPSPNMKLAITNKKHDDTETKLVGKNLVRREPGYAEPAHESSDAAAARSVAAGLSTLNL